MPEVSNSLIGAAGVHFVVSELNRRGVVAMATIRNTAGADVLAWNPRSQRHSVLQVKASQYMVKFWPTNRPDKCLKGQHAYYVFLRYNPESNCFEGFLDSAENVRRHVEDELARQRSRGRREFACWRLPEDAEAVERLAEGWTRWQCA